MEILKRIFSKKQDTTLGPVISPNSPVNVEKILERDVKELDRITNKLEEYEKTIKDHQQKIDDNNQKLELLKKDIEIRKEKYNCSSKQFKKRIDENLQNINKQIDELKNSEKKIPLTLDELNLLKKLREDQLIAFNDINEWTLMLNYIGSEYEIIVVDRICKKNMEIYYSKQSDLMTNIMNLVNKIQEIIAKMRPLELEQLELRKNISKYKEESEKQSETPVETPCEKSRETPYEEKSEQVQDKDQDTIININANNINDNCLICCESLTKKSKGKLTIKKCQNWTHIVHTECFEDWKKTSSKPCFVCQ